MDDDVDLYPEDTDEMLAYLRTDCGLALIQALYQRDEHATSSNEPRPAVT